MYMTYKTHWAMVHYCVKRHRNLTDSFQVISNFLIEISTKVKGQGEIRQNLITSSVHHKTYILPLYVIFNRYFFVPLNGQTDRQADRRTGVAKTISALQCIWRAGNEVVRPTCDILEKFCKSFSVLFHM